jgi:hypothetical protein
MRLNIKEKQAVTREYKARYQAATKKVKSALLDEFTRLTGYHRKSAVRLLSKKPVREILIYGKGEAVKLKPEKKRPANRKGKRLYTDEAIASLRLLWTFFWYKCGKLSTFDFTSFQKRSIRFRFGEYGGNISPMSCSLAYSVTFPHLWYAALSNTSASALS